MTQTHIHLLINHLPIIGSILGAFVLGYGLFTKSMHTMIAAYLVFILAAIGAGIAYFTGEEAEDTVKNIQGIVQASIETHQTFALYALIALIVLGVLSIAGLFLTYKKSSVIRTVAMIILYFSLLSFALVARAGYLGGQIRHTELNNTSTTPTPSGNQEKDND